MKKLICILCACAMLSAVGCGSADNSSKSSGKTVNDVLSNAVKDSSSESSSAAQTESQLESSQPESSAQTAAKVDIDLSSMSSTMAYAELTNMQNSPGNYKGKTVKIKGIFAVSNDNGNTYFACMLTDATACCSQPMEFALKEKKKYPEDYPALDSEITVVGVFGTYNEGANTYCQLSDAQLI